jgi:hypothetical protein
MNSPGIYTNQSTNPNPKGTVPVVEISYKELPKVIHIIPEDYDEEDSSTIQPSQPTMPEAMDYELDEPQLVQSRFNFRKRKNKSPDTDQ